MTVVEVYWGIGHTSGGLWLGPIALHLLLTVMHFCISRSGGLPWGQ